MPALVDQRCFNHVTREAAARCPECGRFFCRECVTEHDERLLCAACLKQLIATSFSRRNIFLLPFRTLQFLLGFLTACFFFYLLGQGLLSLDASVHEGTIWKGKWSNMP